MATNYIAPTDPNLTARSGRSSTIRRFADNAPFPQARHATGWTSVPRSYSPAKEMRLRVLNVENNQTVEKPTYSLNAYIYDSTQRPQDAL